MVVHHPRELLYADDLAIIAKLLEELLVKTETMMSEIKMKDLHLNIGKTKILLSGTNLELLKKSEKNPCAVCFIGTHSKCLISSVMAANALDVHKWQWYQGHPQCCSAD